MASNLWLARRDHGLTPSETREFFQWLNADPSHERAWENCLMFWRHLDPRIVSQGLLSVYRQRTPSENKLKSTRSRGPSRQP
jgi:ferric-dicitrate binding protein FerR (iron transport regulator)